MISPPNSIDWCQIYWGGGTACRRDASKQDAGDGAIWNRPAELLQAPACCPPRTPSPCVCAPAAAHRPPLHPRWQRSVLTGRAHGARQQDAASWEADWHGTGKQSEPMRGSGSAAPPTCCNHSQPLECTLKQERFICS